MVFRYTINHAHGDGPDSYRDRRLCDGVVSSAGRLDGIVVGLCDELCSVWERGGERLRMFDDMPHITFIHGIANKPPEDRILRGWERSLARDGGINLGAEGVTTNMVYWADVMYDKPKGAEGFESLEAAGQEFERDDDDIDMSFLDDAGEEQSALVRSMMESLNFDPDVDDEFEPPEDEAGAEFERIPLPGWLKKRLMKALLRDVHHYLYNASHSPRPGTTFKVQDEIRNRVVEKLEEGSEQSGDERHVVVAHSMGTVIAYDCLKRYGPTPKVDGLITLGGPLGLDEIQDAFAPEWSQADGFPSVRVAGGWSNHFDRLDPVPGLFPEIADDYMRASAEVVNDVTESNGGKWRHSISKYLGQPKMRSALSDMLDL